MNLNGLVDKIVAALLVQAFVNNKQAYISEQMVAEAYNKFLKALK